MAAELRPMRVALVGCGAVGVRRAAVFGDGGRAELILAVDRDPDRARAVADGARCEAGADWGEAVRREDIDAVIVSTPHDALAEIAVAALRHGKHVLVEKPMGRTPDEAAAVLRATEDGAGRRRAADGRLQMLKAGFNHRHHPAVEEAHAALRRGEIGEPMFIRCRYGHGGRPGYEREWRAQRAVSGGGELLDQGVHVLDLCRWFLGEFTDVVGFAPTYFWNSHQGDAGDHPNVEDNAFALLRTGRGQVASVHVSWTQWKNLFSFEVFGRDGYLRAEGLGGSYGTARLVQGRRPAGGGSPEERRRDFPGPDSSWAREWDEFVRAIEEGREPLGSGRDACEAVRIVHAIYESERTGAVVRLARLAPHG
jgi:predicted dehydrogenase